jgi:hypothetical protein
MLEGLTPAARKQREEIDPWWSARLAMPDLSPRRVLQLWGTEVGRRAFHDDIWIASTENRLIGTDNSIVISDCRFPNELTSIKKAGGTTIWVVRGALPEWYQLALTENNTAWDQQWLLEDSGATMAQRYPDVHASEWQWIGHKFDHVVVNDGTLEELYAKIDEII